MKYLSTMAVTVMFMPITGDIFKTLLAFASAAPDMDAATAVMMASGTTVTAATTGKTAHSHLRKTPPEI